MLLRLGYSTKETSASPSNETSSNPVEHIAGLDHEQRSSRLHKDGEPRNHHDSPPTLMGWTPCLNARHPPTQTNPLLGACIWKETTSSHMSSIQGSTEKHRLEKSSPQKKKISICWKRRKTNRRDKESPKKSQCSPSLEPSYTTQKDMSVSSPILSNDNSVGWLLLVRKVKYSISHNCCSEKHESISSPSAHELNSRVDWALQPWMGSNIEDLLWIQNHRKDNRKALHYLQDVMV